MPASNIVHGSSIDAPLRSASSLGSSRDSNRLVNAIRRGRIDLLASLGDLLEDSLVGEVRDNLGSLVFQGDVVTLDTCVVGDLASARSASSA